MTEAEAIEEIRNCLGFNNIVEPYSDEMEAFGMAIQALEKQIPKKPLNIESLYDGDYGNCPCCNKILCDFKEYRVCSNCGQAIDWSE